MTERRPLRLTRGFAGVEYRRASEEAMDAARQRSARTNRENRLSSKLDALLGSVDDDEEDSIER